jgi:UDP-galactopyranose mutase
VERYDALIVGAGFAGATCARVLAQEGGMSVLVIDRREHVAGNAYDYRDEAGVLCHAYGPHIFHTNSQRVVDFLSRFTDWRPYEHRVLAEVDGRFVPMPINRQTLIALHDVALGSEAAAKRYLDRLGEPRARKQTSEDVVLAAVGADLYERLFRGYTRKQWERDPSELDASVCARIPVRPNDDDRYFGDRFQQMPAHGYTRLFEALLEHPQIDLALATDYAEVRASVRAGLLVWTGPIDEYFGFRYGHLPYRSLHFAHEHRLTPGGRLVQPVAQINYPNARIPYTRVTEFRHLTGEGGEVSTLAYEYPCAEGEPYYPVPSPLARALYHRYEALARRRPEVLFVGRLARYQYLNMDQVVASALQAARRVLARGAATPIVGARLRAGTQPPACPAPTQSAAPPLRARTAAGAIARK